MMIWVDANSFFIHFLVGYLKARGGEETGPAALEDGLRRGLERRLCQVVAAVPGAAERGGIWFFRDAPHATIWRLQEDPLYRAERRRKDWPLLREALQICYNRILPGWGFPVVEAPELEADDMMAVLHHHVRTTQGCIREIVLVTADRDLWQLADPWTRIVSPDGRVTGPPSNSGQDWLWQLLLFGSFKACTEGAPWLGVGLRKRLVHDPQFRRFWLEDHPSTLLRLADQREKVDVKSIPEDRWVHALNNAPPALMAQL